MTVLKYSLLTPLLAALVLGACASGQTRLDPGTRVDIPAQGPEPGPLEAEALGYLEAMTTILATEAEDPQNTVVALGRYLDVHHDEIVGVMRRLEVRIGQMTTAERTYYEERFSEYFAPANQRWNEVLGAFRQAHPDAATRVDGLMIYFD